MSEGLNGSRSEKQTLISDEHLGKVAAIEEREVFLTAAGMFVEAQRRGGNIRIIIDRSKIVDPRDMAMAEAIEAYQAGDAARSAYLLGKSPDTLPASVNG